MNDITQAIRNYLQELKLKKYSPESIRKYKCVLNQWSRFLTAHHVIRLQDVTEKDLETYRLELIDRLSVCTLVKHLITLRNFFNSLEQKQHLFINPAGSLMIPHCQKTIQPTPTEEEVKQLLAQPDIASPLGIRDRAFLETLYSTGVRVNELHLMDIYDLDLKQRQVRVMGKGGKERMVPLGKLSVFWINTYLKQVRPELLKQNPGNQALWLGNKGERFHPLSIARRLRDYRDQAGIKCPVTPHALRRACATHMLRYGAHPAVIQLLLGHATLKTLGQYLKVSITDILKTHSQGKVGK